MGISSVAYLGPAGTFAESAVAALPEVSAADRVAAGSVIAALDLLRAGTVSAAVVPIENSVEGSVSGTLDELSAPPALRITAETAIPVRFAVLARPGTVLSDVTAIGTHPHAAAQCRRWLHDHLPHAAILPTGSTAGAAAAVAAGQAPYQAAIASELAGQRFALPSLAVDVADNPDAVTRFVQVELPHRLPPPTGADKTSLVLFIRANRSGALLEILSELAVRGINMTRLESRPTRAQLGEYCFSVDIEGHIAEARVGEALMGLRRTCADVVFLGSYPRLDSRRPDLPAGVSDDDFAAATDWLHELRD